VHPAKEKAQERKLRKVEQEEEAHVARPREAQQEEWRRSLWEELRKKAEWYCGPTVPQDVELWELGWRSQGAVITYLKCPRCGKGGCYVEDVRGQGIVPYWRREKMSWYGCRGKGEQSGMRARDLRGTAREEKVAHSQENQKAQQGKGVANRRSEEPSKC